VYIAAVDGRHFTIEERGSRRGVRVEGRTLAPLTLANGLRQRFTFTLPYEGRDARYELTHDNELAYMLRRGGRVVWRQHKSGAPYRRLVHVCVFLAVLGVNRSSGTGLATALLVALGLMALVVAHGFWWLRRHPEVAAAAPAG
jgi:hypothetical protein